MKKISNKRLFAAYLKVFDLKSEDVDYDEDNEIELRKVADAVTVDEAAEAISWWDCWDGDDNGPIRSARAIRSELGIIDPPTKCRCCNGTGIVE